MRIMSPAVSERVRTCGRPLFQWARESLPRIVVKEVHVLPTNGKARVQTRWWTLLPEVLQGKKNQRDYSQQLAPACGRISDRGGYFSIQAIPSWLPRGGQRSDERHSQRYDDRS